VSLQTLLNNKIENAFEPEILGLENESHKHSSGLGSESHFKILIVSKKFTGLSRVERQRLVYDLFADELKNQIHALSLRLLSPDEKDQAENFVTPNCVSKKT
jgi:BolA family transcriptional regulator, general stress-responsive regulator